MLTIAKLKRWSINYYIDTAMTAQRASTNLRRAAGGLGEYYSEHETRTPVWLCAGDTRTAARLVGLTDIQRAGGEAQDAVVARWLDDGITPNGRRGRSFGDRGVHGFDLTFCAPKSVSLVRVLFGDEVVQKAIAGAHTTALGEAMQYLAQHAGYTRVHNGVTGEKDLVRLPGLVGIAYQHETSRCGDPHLHTHVIVPNRQARADGQLVAIDGTSLYHEAKAAGVIYQATLRGELHRSLGFEWQAVDSSTGMAEVAGVDRATISAWSRRSSQLRKWATAHRAAAEGPLTAAQLAAAQKATRPAKPEELAWATLQAQWRADARGLHLSRAGYDAACAARRAAARTPFDRQRLAAAAERIDKAAFTRADLVEVVAAQLPIDSAQSPRAAVEAAVDQMAVRLSAPRAAHQREGHERFTLDAILAEEAALLDLVDAQDDYAYLWITPEDTEGLSDDQRLAVETIGDSPFLVQPVSAPAGAGKTTSMRALVSAVHHRYRGTAIVLAPTGKAVDIAVREGAGDTGYTVAKALHLLERSELPLTPTTLMIIDEAGMVGTGDLRRLLAATTEAGVKTILVGDQHQLAPVKARGGMFAQLCTDLPWTQHLSEVWRMRDPAERAASLAMRDGNPAALGRAVEWYRTQDRLRCGDQIAMATDALAGYRADIAADKDALLICDTVEMADACNQRLHHDTIAADAKTVTGARGQRIAVGDLIVTRRNDPTIPMRNTEDPAAERNVVRNGHRWRVAIVNPANSAIGAYRLDDHTAAAFPGDYVREHISLGYAVTVHSAQGTTADTTHAVLGESATRSLLYVAMSRGRASNTAYLYEHVSEQAHAAAQTSAVHELWRGSRQEGAEAMHLVAARDDVPISAHDAAALSVDGPLPIEVQRLAEKRRSARLRRETEYRELQRAARVQAQDISISQDRHISCDEGLEL